LLIPCHALKDVVKKSETGDIPLLSTASALGITLKEILLTP
jgi:hypothetical protein